METAVRVAIGGAAPPDRGRDDTKSPFDSPSQTPSPPSAHPRPTTPASHGSAPPRLGLAPRLAKIVPATAIMLSSYDWGKSFFDARRR